MATQTAAPTNINNSRPALRNCELLLCPPGMTCAGDVTVAWAIALGVRTLCRGCRGSFMLCSCESVLLDNTTSWLRAIPVRRIGRRPAVLPVKGSASGRSVRAKNKERKTTARRGRGRGGTAPGSGGQRPCVCGDSRLRLSSRRSQAPCADGSAKSSRASLDRTAEGGCPHTRNPFSARCTISATRRIQITWSR